MVMEFETKQVVVKKAAKIKTILNDSSLLETYMLENNLTLENVGEHLLNNNEEIHLA